MVPAIIVGDQTTGGGRVIEGSPNTTVDGKPVARYGDKATCTVKGHGSIVTIVEGDTNNLIEGKPTAYHNALLSCGCRVLASQSLYLVEKCGGMSGTAETAANAVPTANVGYDDRFVLMTENGQFLKNAHYAIEFPDGRMEYGISDDQGHTDLHLTGEEAKELTIYLEGAPHGR